MKATIAVITLLLTIVSMGIWLGMMHSVLTMIGATSNMWVMYWCYVPTLVLITVLSATMQFDK